MPPSITGGGADAPSVKTKVKTKPGAQLISREEVAKHNKDGDRWIIIRDRVYDISEFIHIHPGSDVPLRGLSGKDVSSVYMQYHPVEQWETTTKPYLIGKVPEQEKRKHWSSDLAKDFEQMIRKIKADGLMDIGWTQRFWYMKWMVVYIALLYLSCKCIMSGNFWLLLLGSVGLALYWQQIAFIGHDAGHNGITHVRDYDWWWGIWVTSTFGVSGKWWKRNHNTHHIFPNSVDWDPDIQHLPFFAICDDIFNGYFSQYYEWENKFDHFAKLMISMQHYLWIPIMGIARYNMYFQSFFLVFQCNKYMERRIPEFLSLVVYWIWYVYVLSHIPHTSWLVISIVLSHFLCGLLHFQIVLSHFPMDTYMGNGYENDKGENWLVRQFETTMDINCPWYMDWFHGGLQYQCVHHLIPRLPRPNLRYVRDNYIKQFAERNGIKYHNYSWFEAFGIMQSMMVRQAKNATKVKLEDSYIFDLLMGNG